MKSLVQTYLFFKGNCGEALKFYQKALGAKIGMIMRYQDSPERPPPGMLPENWGSKIMHSSFSLGDNIIMASDGCGGGEQNEPSFSGFSISYTLPTSEEADEVFASLSEGGEVTMPIGKTFWSPKFGMLTDKFGIGWMISIPEETKA
jgi:PhnB protein